MKPNRLAVLLLMFLSASVLGAPSVGIKVAPAALGAATAPVSLPGITRVTLPMITPSQSEQSIHSLVLPADLDSPAAAVGAMAQAAGPSSIVELARALRNDPDLIYEYVRNNIEYYPVWGVQKGPLGTILDNQGTAFDQAALMVALLRQAGYTATFVKGGIELTPAQVQSWLGVSTANACAVGSLLANGGVPVTGLFSVSGGCTALTDLQIDHMWVKVIIGGTAYVFDPSFKPHAFKSGVNLTTASGYNATTYLGQAKAGATQTADYVQNINRTNIRNNLTTYAGNLASFVRSNLPAGDLGDLIGGMTITPISATPPLRQTSLPYQDALAPAPTEFVDIPASYKPTLRIRYAGIDRTYTSDVLYGARLTITYDGTNHAVLSLEGTTVATGNVVSPGTTGTVTFDVVHNAYPGLVDQTFTQSIRGGGTYLVGNGWGPAGRGPGEFHRTRLGNARAAGLADTSETVLGSTLAIISSAWIAQTNRAYYLHDRLARTTTTLHHQVGIAGYYDTSYVDLPGNVVSIASQDADNAKEDAVFFSSAMHTSIFESITVQQMSSISAVSTVKLIDIAAVAGNRIYNAASGNFAGTVGPALTTNGCSGGTVANFQAIVNAGYQLILPDHCNLGENIWSGIGYFQIFQSGGSTSIGAIISGSLAGGFATLRQLVDQLNRNGFGNSESPLLALNNTGNSLGEPIDLTRGHYLAEHVDMKAGMGEFPKSLAFTRLYSSGRGAEAGPLGNGWTHNFATTAAIGSDGLQGMGDASALDAVGTVVETMIALDLLTDAAKPLDKMVVAILGQRWFGDQLINNTVMVRQGVNGNLFVKLPDGSYNAPPSNPGKLLQNGDGTFTVETLHKGRYNFNAAGKVATYDHPNGLQVKFTYSGSDLVQVQNSMGFTLAFTNVGGRITQVADGTRHADYTYDGAGNFASYTNATGATATYQYDFPGRLTANFFPSDPGVAYITNVYDSLGRVKTQALANGKVYNFFFAGTRSEQVAPDGSSNVSYVDAMGKVLKAIDPLGRVTTNSYDGQSRLVSTVFPEGDSVSYDYDDAPCLAQLRCTHNIKTFQRVAKPASGQGTLVNSFTYESTFNKIASATDPLGNTTNFTYTAQGEPLALVQPTDSAGVQPQMTYTYSAFAPVGYPSFVLPTKVTKLVASGDAVDETTSYNTANGYLPQTKVVDAGAGKLSLTTTYTYNAFGDMTQLDGPRSDVTDVTTYAYDAERRLIQDTDALGKQTRYGYDAYGELIRTAAQIGAQWMVTCRTYNASGLLLKIWGPAVTASDTTCPAAAPPTSVTDYSYDDLNRLLVETRNLPAGEGGSRTTQIVYGLDGRTQSLMRAAGTALAQPEATYTYTPNGRLATITDAKGNRTTHVYDGFDRRLRTLFPDPFTPNTSSNADFEQYGFDAAGNPVSRRTRSGQTITSAYDNLHRLIGRTYSNAADNVTVSYDLMGRQLSANYANGSHSVTYAWDHASRLLSTSAGGRGVSYQYDAAGNRVRTTWPEATPFFVTTTFDALNRASSMLELGVTPLVNYAYDDLSRRTAENLGNGTSTSASYSTQGDLASLAHNLGGSSADVTFGYSRNQARELTGVNASNPLYQWGGSANGTRTYAANGLNQYSSVAGTTLTYDGNGNLAGDGVWSYAYDPENRLRTASGNSTSASLAWDAPGRLRQTTIAGTTTNLLYDGPRLIAEYDGAGNLLRRFVHGPGVDEPLVRYEGSGTGNKSWLYADHVGSVVAAADSSGNATAAFTYGPFGEMGTTGAPRFGFTGQQFIAGLNLYDYRARFYSPALGRFLQADPLGWLAGMNSYAYVANDPLNTIDPNGLWGVGGQFGGGADVGVGVKGAGMQIQYGGGAFYDTKGNNGWSLGGYESDGFMVGGPGRDNSVTSAGPAQGRLASTYALGGGIGGEAGIFLTNANTVTDLGGAADTWNASLSPFAWAGIPIEISISLSVGKKGTWILSIGMGPGVVGSFSNYPTNTETTDAPPKPKSKLPPLADPRSKCRA